MTSSPENKRTREQPFDLCSKVPISDGADYVARFITRAYTEPGATVAVSTRDESCAKAVADKLPCSDEIRRQDKSLLIRSKVDAL